MYFSWTDLDEIHGDQFRKEKLKAIVFEGLASPSKLTDYKIQSLRLKEIAGEGYYWINVKELRHARTGQLKEGITETEALAVARKHILSDLEVAKWSGLKLLAVIMNIGEDHFQSMPSPISPRRTSRLTFR